MELKYLNVVGLMSGTSMDGIDGTLVKTNGKSLYETNIKVNVKYSSISRSLLNRSLTNFDNFTDKEKEKLIKYITNDHYKAVKYVIKTSGITPDLIGFHGQTIFHHPEKKISIQLGDPILLSKLTKLKVISDFRNHDIQNGGQGAPLAPIYHKYLINKLKLDLPCCFVNIGGVANITYYDGIKLIGFDTGPGNGLMDCFMREKLNLPFDNKGLYAKSGIINFKILEKFIKSAYFKETWPKSLDRQEFAQILCNLNNTGLSINDSMATLLAFTVKTIILGISQVPIYPKSIIVTGGGAKNLELIKQLSRHSKTKVLVGEKINLNSDLIEAQMIAYITARTFHNLPTTFPDTTGCKVPTIAGEIFNYNLSDSNKTITI